jgi:hypothetical protein
MAMQYSLKLDIVIPPVLLLLLRIVWLFKFFVLPYEH